MQDVASKYKIEKSEFIKNYYTVQMSNGFKLRFEHHPRKRKYKYSWTLDDERPLDFDHTYTCRATGYATTVEEVVQQAEYWLRQWNKL